MANMETSGGVEAGNEMENLSEKKDYMTDKLQKREDDRVAALQRRKEEKESVSAVNEKSDFFFENFNSSRVDIDRRLAASDSVAKNGLQDHFDGLTVSLQKLQKFVADSAMFLTSYELQRTQDGVSKLSTAIQEKKDLLAPKKKFAFKLKKKTAEKPTVGDGNDPERINSRDEPDLSIALAETSITNHKGEHLVKKPEELNQNDVTLANLEGCTVHLFGSPSTVHMNNLTNCRILCGPVSSSVFIDGCKQCTFVLACQQLRCHTTVDTKFYLHVTSRAIIEDCKTLFFAPFDWNYAEIDNHYELSGLSKSRNNWYDVDDFNWLASDAHSPNWSVLEEGKREKFE